MAPNSYSPDGEQGFGSKPFEALDSSKVQPPSAARPVPPATTGARAKNRGRVDIIRQTAGRGGKTVTVVTRFVGIGLAEKQMLARQMQKACGTGGTVKDGRIEIQGDQREAVARILADAGFQPVFAGG